MTHNPDTLERLAPLSGAPSRGYDDLLRLRAKRQRAQKIGVLVVVTALIIALLSVGLVTQDRSEKPVNPPDESQPPAFTGMVITQTGGPDRDLPGDLVAHDATTGEVRTFLESQSLRSLPGDPVIKDEPMLYAAAISGDGSWVAFNVGGCAGQGLWVTNGADETRQLVDPCGQTPAPYGNWEWSPSGAQLLAVLGSPGGQRLVLIDPATGDRTDLGRTEGEVMPLAWSSDGTRIAYGAVPAGSPNPNGNGSRSVYTVGVDGGKHALIAESIGQLPGREEGSGIQWSPDGTRIAVLTLGDPDSHNGTLYVMNADGSGRQPLAESVHMGDGQGSPNIVWSPDGTRIAYVTDSNDRFRIWSAALDGSPPVLAFDPGHRISGDAGGPTWSPDGTRIAFRFDTHLDQHAYLVANADGTGHAQKIDGLQYRSWRGGWYFCECYG